MTNNGTPNVAFAESATYAATRDHIDLDRNDTRVLIAQLQGAVEALIDGSSLAAVLDAIGQVANGKAEHLRSNWQDDNSARYWNAAARKADLASAYASDHSI